MTQPIRESGPTDLQDVLQVHREAFGQNAEANLVRDLLSDLTAKPLLSLLAAGQDGRVLAHVLFTRLRLTEPDSDCPAEILAPLAVRPEAQGMGLGSRLVNVGLETLKNKGVRLVFVLGDPGYYGRFGFTARAGQALAPPFDLPPEYAEAWQALRLDDDAPLPSGHRLRCAVALDKPELWLP